MPFSNYFKKNWKNYLLLLCSILTFLIALEMYSRIYYSINGPNPVGLYEKDEDTLYKLKAGFKGKTFIEKKIFGEGYKVLINSKGLRDYKYSYKRSNNSFRILVLGDSFTFGMGVSLDNTFPKVLEKKLNNGSIDIKYEVINSGVPAYSTYQELGFLKKQGLMYNPDIIILAFYHNDIPENNPILMQNYAKYRYQFLTYNFVRDKVINIINRLKNQDSLLPINLDNFRTFSRQYSKEMEGNWILTKKYLKDVNRISKRRNISLVLINIPSFEQTLLDHTFDLNEVSIQFSDENLYSEIKPNKDNVVNLSEFFDFEKPDKLLRNFIKKENIIFIDLLPEFKKSQKDLYLLPEDFHYNREGYKLVAEILYKELIKMDLIKIE